MKEQSARVIKDGPMRASDGDWQCVCVLKGVGGGCYTISVGPMGVGGKVRVSPSLFKGRINKEMSL